MKLDRRAIRGALRSVPYFDKVVAKTLRPYFSGPHFQSSAQYWEDRYRLQGDSGDGSYGRLAQFKADIINAFVREHRVASVIELGCGDGAQLKLADYPRYVGVDVSEATIGKCRRAFANDAGKRFYHSSELPPHIGRFGLGLSLDVVYHLIEDETFESYMLQLFAFSECWVIIYSSNEDRGASLPHVRHRKFSDWVAANISGWVLDRKIAQKYPFDPSAPHRTSFADFYIYRNAYAQPA